MRRRSVAGPLILILIGGLFLWNNLRPDIPIWELLSQYWPFFLIAWGVLQLIEIGVAAPLRGPCRAASAAAASCWWFSFA